MGNGSIGMSVNRKRAFFQPRLIQILLAIAVIFSLFALVVQPTSAQSGPVEVQLDENGFPSKAYFNETGHHLSGEFLHTWLSKGDFTIYGFPISEPVVEKGRIVQYFERARLELWPEHAGTEWVIQGTLLGNWKAEDQQLAAPFSPILTDPRGEGDTRDYFIETRHTLANAFQQYWNEHGGVHVFGFPISEEFTENGFTVQYFERGRFEWHPENAGTPYEILLGHLGREWVEAYDVDTVQTDQAGNAVVYDAGLFDPNWQYALQTNNTVRWAVVSVEALNVRPTADINSSPIDTVYSHRPLQLSRMVRGEDVEGVDSWYELATGGFVPAIYVDPLVVTPPPSTYWGNWIDVNLSDFYAVAYSWDTPVYVSTFTAGRSDRTPKGVFAVQSQVRSETMDSATVGIPKGHPEYYYLENVEFTQYFMAGGFAVHGNYWTPEWAFGQFSSNGCVGLMWEDAQFFWYWLDIGSTVAIHF